MRRFIGRYWIEILMITPLLAYLLGFTMLPVLSNLDRSLTGQDYGRRHDLAAARVRDLEYDHEQADGRERVRLKIELAAARSKIELMERSPEAGRTTANYRRLWKEPGFRSAVANTLAITLAGLSLQLTAGMILALLVTRRFRGRGFFRTVVLTPLGLPTIVSAAIMTYIFDTSGYLNAILYKLGLVGTVGLDWARGGWLSVLMIVLADTWKVLPMMVLLFIAGLESVPGTVLEAAAIDGAGPVKKFFTVTLPLMKPFITAALIIRAIDAFRIFELPLVLAGTASLPVISTYTYSEFTRQNFNNSAAAGTVLTVIILLFVIGYLAVTERA